MSTVLPNMVRHIEPGRELPRGFLIAGPAGMVIIARVFQDMRVAVIVPVRLVLNSVLPEPVVVAGFLIEIVCIWIPTV
ncbi:MAG: hypothetical protein H6P98_682, partial [Candidatus Aminicenantes bacterium]|nr:hypothetical protein [Candidatus Aminicenantes bacterium]